MKIIETMRKKARNISPMFMCSILIAGDEMREIVSSADNIAEDATREEFETRYRITTKQSKISNKEEYNNYLKKHRRSRKQYFKKVKREWMRTGKQMWLFKNIFRDL